MLEPIITKQMDDYGAESTPGELSQRELERECNEHALFGQEYRRMIVLGSERLLDRASSPA